jgi:FkbH-like protein
VTVIGAPVDAPWRLCQLISEQGLFDTAAITDDDLGRVQDYKSQTHRAELERSFSSRDEFLASMEIVCTFQSALTAPLARSVQILAKTNQFNLTTRRHSAVEVEQFAAAPGGQAIALRVRDRFGDSGVVGLALARTEGETCLIDSLLLSCRVIGRGVETALLAVIAENARRAGACRLVGEFIPTKKNQLCASFYSDHGFLPLPQTDGSSSRFYELDLTDTLPSTPKWITIEGDQVHEHAAGTVVAS